MPSTKENIITSHLKSEEFITRYNNGELDRSHYHDYLELVSQHIYLQTIHLQNSSEALVEFAQNLLNFTRAKCQQDQA